MEGLILKWKDYISLQQTELQENQEYLDDLQMPFRKKMFEQNVRILSRRNLDADPGVNWLKEIVQVVTQINSWNSLLIIFVLLAMVLCFERVAFMDVILPVDLFSNDLS